MQISLLLSSSIVFRRQFHYLLNYSGLEIISRPNSCENDLTYSGKTHSDSGNIPDAGNARTGWNQPEEILIKLLLVGEKVILHGKMNKLGCRL